MNLMIMATFIEAKPFIELMPLFRLDHALFPVFEQKDITLIISGIGKVNAAMATAYGCATYRPDYVLNFGAAGATGHSASLGEIYQIGKAIEYDGVDLRTGMSPTYTPEILKGFQTATIATSDIPVIEKKDRELISFSAALADMESSAIIQVCRKFRVRCHLFKFVTDTPDHPCEKDIKKHIQQYRLPFYRFIDDSVLPAFHK